MEMVEVSLPVEVVDFLSEVGRLSGLRAGEVAAVLIALAVLKEGSLQAAVGAD